MPRFYIDLRGHFGTTEDPCGLELPDAVAARTEALRIAEDLLNSWHGMLPSYCDEISVEVRREQDRHPVVRITYSELAKHVGLAVHRGPD